MLHKLKQSMAVGFARVIAAYHCLWELIQCIKLGVAQCLGYVTLCEEQAAVSFFIIFIVASHNHVPVGLHLDQRLLAIYTADLSKVRVV